MTAKFCFDETNLYNDNEDMCTLLYGDTHALLWTARSMICPEQFDNRCLLDIVLIVSTPGI